MHTILLYKGVCLIIVLVGFLSGFFVSGVGFCPTLYPNCHTFSDPLPLQRDVLYGRPPTGYSWKRNNASAYYWARSWSWPSV